jgi:hypothetical protein
MVRHHSEPGEECGPLAGSPRSAMPNRKICERIKQLGFGQYKEVKLYGEVFELTADPVADENDSIFVAARERRSGRERRLPIPLNIVEMAKQQNRVA